MAKYRVTIVNFPESLMATQRIRAGVVVDRVNGYEGELTDEQIKAIKADSYLKLEKADRQSANDAKTHAAAEGSGDEEPAEEPVPTSPEQDAPESEEELNAPSPATDEQKSEEGGDVNTQTDKPLTKNEMLGQAAAEGLTLNVSDRNTVAQIQEAIEKARAAKAAEEQ